MSVYLKKLYIEDVRGLKDIAINLSEERMQHLIITGKNGSGKTSVLDAISSYLNGLSTDQYATRYTTLIETAKQQIDKLGMNATKEIERYEKQKNIQQWTSTLCEMKKGVEFELSIEKHNMFTQFTESKYILAYYKADRVFQAFIPEHIEKVELKNQYTITEAPRTEFLKFLVDMKTMQAFANTAHKTEKADSIKSWFDNFENLLKQIFDEPSLKLEFDEERYAFDIKVEGKPTFGFNTLSSGYGAILDIIVDIILRMKNVVKMNFVFDMPGIVLIDEIETHLHLELQKNIMQFLTSTFSNVQFIVTTHSPFILNSIEDAVIYDLEKEILVKEGLVDVSYEGIIKSYFDIDTISNELKSKYEVYQQLVSKEKISDEDLVEIERIEKVLDEVPDFLAIEITTEYEKLKLEFATREDI